MKLLLTATILATILAMGSAAVADSKLPREMEGIEILARTGAALPRDLAFVDQDGKRVTLGEYVDGKQPVLLVLAYYRCPMLCSTVMNGLVDGLKGVAFKPGESYRVVSVSFDHRDTAELAAAKRSGYIEALGKPLAGARAWDFLIAAPGDQASVRQLAEAVGFRYRWDEKTQQFAHGAGAFLFTPDGKLARTLYGIQFPPRDLRLSLVEASEGKLGGVWDYAQLFCYHWDPGEGYTLAMMNIMRLGGALTVLLLGGFLVHLWRRDRQKTRAEQMAA